MQRPTSVTVFGILNLLFGALGVFGVFMMLALLFGERAQNNPVVRLMEENSGFGTWMKLSIPLGIISTIAVFVSGIGLLLMKRWGRTLAFAYAVLAIASGAVSLIMNFTFVVRPLMDQAARQQGPEAAGAVGGVLGGMCGGCFGLLYPILLLYFMTRPSVIEAFQSPPPPLAEP